MPSSLWLVAHYLLPLAMGYRKNLRSGMIDLVSGSDYTFDRYKSDFQREYKDNVEHDERAAIFKVRLEEVNSHNALNLSWRKAVNDLTDWTEEELGGLMGYRPSARQPAPSSILETSAMSCTQAQGSCVEEGIVCCGGLICSHSGSCEEIRSAESVDHAAEMDQVSEVMNQLSCGSCWAIAATATLDGHAALFARRQGKVLKGQLSPQALLSCTANPRRCGGDGGCRGATVELAFDALRRGVGDLQHGMLPLDMQSYRPHSLDCNAISSTSLHDPPSVHITGWKQVPMNDPKALMDAVATVGPVGVSIAAKYLHSYGDGVMTDLNDFLINHAVVMTGYGHDEERGMKYWKIRNPWGPSWGESGYFRLQRNFPDAKEPFGVDHKPSEGVVCVDENGNYPAEATYSGVQGILADSSYPVGLTVDSRLMAPAAVAPASAGAAPAAEALAGMALRK